MSFLHGKLLYGKYELLNKIGEGSYGAIYSGII